MRNVAFVLLFGLLALPAMAVDENLYTIETRGSQSRLARINPMTGNIVEHLGDWFVGSLPAGLTYDPVLDTLLAADGFGGSLLSIDRWTGERTVLAELDVSLRGLTVHPTSFEMYGIGLDGELYRVDRETNALDFIADESGPFWHGLAFAPDGTLYGANTGTDELNIIDPNTAVAQPIGPTAFEGALVGLSFDATGALYGSINSLFNQSSLVTLDTMTGSATLVGSYGSDMGFGSLAFAPVPTPGGLAVICLFPFARRHRR